MSTKLLFLVTSAVIVLHAQPMPPEYDQVLKTRGKSGDFKANVLKVNIPRNDLKVTWPVSRRPRHSVSVAGFARFDGSKITV